MINARRKHVCMQKRLVNMKKFKNNCLIHLTCSYIQIHKMAIDLASLFN